MSEADKDHFIGKIQGVIDSVDGNWLSPWAGIQEIRILFGFYEQQKQEDKASEGDGCNTIPPMPRLQDGL